MEYEETFRPPLLAGERVVWPGIPPKGKEDEGLCGPFHGSVVWMGQLPEMGASWAIGVQFDREVPGGGDGVWRGCRLFSCKQKYGLVIPLAALVKEKDFIIMNRLQQVTKDTTMPSAPDLSLAPEPPPPKSRATPSAPSMDKHTRSYFKKCGGGPTQCSSMASGAEGVQKEPMEIKQKETIKSKKKEGSKGKISSNVDKNVTIQLSTKKCVEQGRVKDKKSGNLQEVVKKNEEEEDWHDALDDFGETMIRKSTVKSKESLAGRHSAPGSPRLERVQAAKVLTSGNQPNSPTNQEKRMTSPVSMSSSHGPDAKKTTQGSQYKLRREKSTGFLNIFRWFRNRDKKKQTASIEQTTGGGSQNSLSSAASSIAYYPITKSKSAECPKRMTLSGGEEPSFGLTRRYNLFKHSSSESNSGGKRNVAQRSASTVTGKENRKSTVSSSSTISRKKRPAPQPPGMGDSVSVSSETSFTSLSRKEVQHASEEENITDLSKTDGQKLYKAKSEGLIYTRAKRRAPMPPDKANQARGNGHSQDQGTLKKQGVCSPASESQIRPVSNISSVSSFSPSQSSTIKSLSSNSFTTPSATSSQYSSESIRLESGFLKQDLPRSQSSSSVPDTSKVTLSPRPWYKRKKSKDRKDTLKHEKSQSSEDKIYDSWMPDIQFVRGKIGLQSETSEASEESTHSIKSDTSKSSSKKVKEEEKKEKRKSQISLLASISELDRAAAEHIEREHQIKKAEKEAYDNQFYNSSLHILTQNDVSSTERVTEQEKTTHIEKVKSTTKTAEIISVCEGATATVETPESSKRNGQNECHDDKTAKQTLTQKSAPYTENPTLKITESTTTKTSEVSKTESFVRSYFKGQSHKKTGKKTQPEAATALPTSDKKPNVTPSPPAVKKNTPMQKAVLDAEMFYQLAKDMQGSPKQPPKLATPPSPTRRNPPEREQEQTQPQQEQTSKEPEDSSQSRYFPKPNRNFGVRMNHLFSPEVSTILEASETMTSTATTPADDIYEDILSSIMQERRANSQEDLLSEVNSEYRLNSADAREIMQEIANVQREIAQINMEEDQERLLRDETRKADRIREEILQLRERNNFEAWNIAAQRTNVDMNRPPAPIDIINSSTVDHKKKWVCDVCTLINLPWRLQCEACGTRRPFNPKRVGDDVDSSQVETDLSQTCSLSDSSSNTVVHADSRPSGISQGNLPSNEDSTKPPQKKKKDKNWEQELQTYFKSFDSSSSTQVESPNSRRIEKENKGSSRSYGRSKEETKCKVAGQPSKVSATVSSETSTSDLSQEKRILGSKTTESPVENKHLDQESSETATGRDQSEHRENVTDPSLDEIRRVRLARFMSSLPRPQENQTECQNVARNEALSPQSKRKMQAPWSRSTSESGESPSPNTERRGSSTSAVSNGDETQKWVVEQASQQLASLYEKSNEKNYYKKEYQKSPVLKPSGAVKNVISIFNQMDEINSVAGKPKQSKRRSVGAVLGRRQRFEQLLQEGSPEVERKRSAIKETPRPQNTALVGQREGEIASAIAKFDSLVAIAESEKVAVAQTNAVRSRIYRPNMNKTQTGVKLPGLAEQGAVLRTSEFSSWDDTSNSPTAPGVIKDGVLYTSGEQRPRSLSVSSGTFELIGAKDFETIEAHHKEYFPESPTEEKKENPSVPVAGTKNGSIDSCQSSSVGLIPHVIVESSLETPNFQSAGGSTSAFSGKVNEIQSQCEEAGKNGPVLTTTAEAGEVEKLSRQLTEAEGIATFKANLKVAEPEIGQMNTLNINRLLRRLEGAITRGNHAEASRLAHDLAELRISCSVVRNPKIQGAPGIGVGLADWAEQKVPHDARPPTLSRIPEDIKDKNKGNIAEDTTSDDSESTVVPSDVSHSPKDSKVNENSDKVKTEEISDTQHKTGSKKECDSLPNGSGKETEISNQEKRMAVPEAELNSGQGAIPKQKRETKVNVGRREVKSDTISKLPDAPETMMIEEQTCVPFNVQMYVEDKTSHQGPISVTVVQTMTVGDLRAKVEKDFGFPPEVQRWILGRRLANDDNMTLEQHKVTTEGCPIFLYLVAPESGIKERKNSSTRLQDNSSDEYRGSEIRTVRYQDPSLSDENIHSDHVVQRDSHGKEHYRFYNPDTYSYEMSFDICDDRNGEKEEEERLMRQEMEENKDNTFYENVNVIHATQLERENDNQVHNSYTSDSRVKEIEEKEINIARTSIFHSAHVQEFKEGQPIVLKPKVTPVMQNGNPTIPLGRNRVQVDQVEEQTMGNVNGVTTENSSAANNNWMAKEADINKNQQQSLGEKKTQSVVGQPKFNHQPQLTQQLQNYPQPQQQLQPSQLLQSHHKQPQEQQMQNKSELTERKKNITIAAPSRDGNDLQANKENVPQTNHENVSQMNEQNPQEAKASSKSVTNGWVCPSCTLVNPWTRPGCEACATERPQDTVKQPQQGKVKKKGKVKRLGMEMTALEQQDIVANQEAFECRVCFLDVNVGEGVVLRDCLHTFCRECLANAVKYSDTADVKCPYRDNTYSCPSSLQDREIRALVSAKQYEKHLSKSVKQAEGSMQNVFHCKTPDCPGFCQFEDNVNDFNCDVCRKTSCLTCQAQHMGMTCKEYQDRITQQVDEAAMKTKKFFDDIIRRGDGLPCPKCSVMLVRKWGCDWMRCPMCRTEICWVTRGPRWGPGCCKIGIVHSICYDSTLDNGNTALC
ncbi:uncharacterized protein LOC143032427 isoform X2 [Oratosquilla oratoria]|uniref:uncharacterized protein LOC143032427 isoform X2 n=1 Tax=Oratosquilla oratoria TaxID=337810 RepID=UPI003F76AE05